MWSWLQVSELAQQFVLEGTSMGYPMWLLTKIATTGQCAYADSCIYSWEVCPTTSRKQRTGLHQVIKITDYSSLNRLLAVTACAYRCINKLHRSQPRQSGPLTAKELNSAQMGWSQNCQQWSYPREISSFKSKPVCSGIKKSPLVKQLRLLANDTGLLCCGGRIHNAPLSKVAKFPYLLPQNNHLTSLIVIYVNAFLSHAGVHMSRNCYTAVQFVGNMDADHMPLQSWHYSQRPGCRMCHHSPLQA